MVKRKELEVEIIPPEGDYTGNIFEDVRKSFFYHEMNLQEILPKLQLKIDGKGVEA